LEKPSDAERQARLDAAQELVREAARPRDGENHKSAVARAAAMLGLSFRKAKSLLYREPAAVSPEEFAELRSRVLGVMEARRQDAEREAAALRERITQLQGKLCAMERSADLESVSRSPRASVEPRSASPGPSDGCTVLVMGSPLGWSPWLTE